MEATGFFTKSEIIKGEYKPTELDNYKASVDFLIVGVGNRYEIFVQRPIDIKENRSIKKINNNSYFVTEKALESLKANHSWACDF